MMNKFYLIGLLLIISSCRGGGDGESQADSGTGLIPVKVGGIQIAYLASESYKSGYDPYSDGIRDGIPVFKLSCEEIVGRVKLEISQAVDENGSKIEPAYSYYDVLPRPSPDGPTLIGISPTGGGSNLDPKKVNTFDLTCISRETATEQNVAFVGKLKEDAEGVKLATADISIWSLQRPTFKFTVFGGANQCSQYAEVKNVFGQAIVSPYQSCTQSTANVAYDRIYDKNGAELDGEMNLPGITTSKDAVNIGVYQEMRVSFPAIYYSFGSGANTTTYFAPSVSSIQALPMIRSAVACATSVNEAKFYWGGKYIPVSVQSGESQTGYLNASVGGGVNSGAYGDLSIKLDLTACDLNTKGLAPSQAAQLNGFVGQAALIPGKSAVSGKPKELVLIASHEIYHAVGTTESDEHYTGKRADVNLMNSTYSDGNPSSYASKLNLFLPQWKYFRKSLNLNGFAP